MKKAWLLPLGLFLVTATGAAGTQSAGKPPIPTTGAEAPELIAFDRAVLALMRQHEIPGASLAVARDGQLVLARGYGYADTLTRDPVRPGDRFRIASVSKPITAVGVLRLVEDGRLRLEDRAFEILDGVVPPENEFVDRRLAQVTVGQLLQHRGGFDRTLGLDPTLVPGAIAERLNVEPPVTIDEIIRFMLGRPLDFAPGTRTAYSNFGYAVLGRIIEETSGRNYETFIEEKVLAPVGASRTELGRSFPSDRPADEVSYYHPAPPLRVPAIPPRSGRVPLPDGGFDLELMAAHGGWISTPTDLLRFLTAVDGWRAPSDILSRSSVRRMLAPPGGGRPDTTYYAAGWYVRPGIDGEPEAWWHAGDLPGTTALLMSSGRTGWALLLNRSPWDRSAHETIRRTMEEAETEVRSWPVER